MGRIDPIGNLIAGKRVGRGEQLLEKQHEGGPHVLAPLAGEVGSTRQVRLLDGHLAAAVEVKPNGADQSTVASPAQALRAEPSVGADDNLESWIERLRGAGVSASRWTSPDLLGQLTEAVREPVDALICNVLDVDPTVPVNTALAAHYARELVAGLRMLAGITKAERVLIAVGANAPVDWTGDLRGELLGWSAARIVALVNAYPQADPSLLMYSLLNRRLAPGRLPTDLGAIVLDASAAIAVGRLVLNGEPMLTTPLAVRDHVRRESHFCAVPIGTPLASVLAQLGMPSPMQMVVRGGDVLRDIQLAGPIVVGGTELIVHANMPEPPINPDPCIRCGWCFESCPTSVQPANCLEAAQREDVDLALRFGIEGCIDCGICSYVCPSHLPILAGIRQMRSSIAQR
jgi:electron transport complex protein RnfC